MIRLNNNIVTDSSGAPYGLYSLPTLEFDVRDNKFPPASNVNVGSLIFYNSGDNKIYIDYGDGTSYEESFTGNWSRVGTDVMKTYPNTNSKIVKVSFDYPWKITGVYARYMNFYGDFITNVGLYKLNSLENRYTKFNSISSFKGGIFTTFTLENATNTQSTELYDSISKSRITNLLLGVFNLSNSSTNKLQNLINIQGLNKVCLFNCGLTTTSLPSNLKDISTLRMLILNGNNQLKTLPKALTDCKQITTIEFGRQVTQGLANGYCPVIESWGDGIAGMDSLTSLYAEGIFSTPGNFTTDVVTGLELNNSIRNLYLGNIYGTTTELDTFIGNLYSLITSNKTPGTGTTGALRGLTMVLRNYGSSYDKQTPRPNGTYQAPSGFIQNSDNGTPASAMEKLYVIVKNYRWTITVVGASGGITTQTLIP